MTWSSDKTRDRPRKESEGEPNTGDEFHLQTSRGFFKKNLYSFHSFRVIYNRQYMEAAQVSISRRVDKTTIGHVHNGNNGILLGCKKENFTLCDSMDRPGECYAK